MGLYTKPPPVHDFSHDKPTLLVCWWVTIFCFTIILLRILGRFIRSERLFLEDKTVALALVPLFLRMGCVHVILIYGTNNGQFDGIHLSSKALHRRTIGSGLVLASRILHAATLWILKVAILEFFKRISDALSVRFSQISLIFTRCILALTFVAIIISDLAECHPFSRYWQVLPDPGGQCRQGYAQLLTLSVSNVFTDLLLVLFPVPIIFFSHQSVKRKIQLILLFSLSLGVVGVTLYRVTRVIETHGSQPIRSLLASVELLFATTAANALVLGSFVRDRGVKKNKFRGGSVVDSMDRSSVGRSRRPTMNRHWGSDEDLVRDLGLGVQRNLRDSPDLDVGDDVILGHSVLGRSPRAAPLLMVDEVGKDGGKTHGIAEASRTSGDSAVRDLNSWNFQFPDERRKSGATRSAQSGQSDDDTLLAKDAVQALPGNISTSTPRRVSFLEAGDVLGTGMKPEPTANDGGPLSPGCGAGAMPLSYSLPPSPAHMAGSHGSRRGSSALLQDLNGLLGPLSPRQRQTSSPKANLHPAPRESPYESSASPSYSASPTAGAYLASSNLDSIVLIDPGGLLEPSTKR